MNELPGQTPQAPFPQARPLLRKKRKGLPMGLIILAVFCAVLGGAGVMGGLYSLVAGAIFGEEDVGAMVDEYLDNDAFKSLPPEYGQFMDSIRDNDAYRARIKDVAESISGIVPARWLFDLTSFALSLMSLLAGIGLLARKDWGRKLTMWFIAVATVAAVGWGYAIIPGMLRFLDAYVRLAGGKGLAPNVAEMFNSYWLGLWIVLVLMHALVIVYLASPKIKEPFQAG